MTFMPYLGGLLGIYIRNLHRPLNGIRVSSTHACAPMEYTFWQIAVKMLKMLDTAAAGSCPLLSSRVEESSNLRATNKTSHLFCDMVPRKIGRPVQSFEKRDAKLSRPDLKIQHKIIKPISASISVLSVFL